MNLIKYSDGIIWMTSKQTGSNDVEKSKKTASQLHTASIKHIMFSYNRETRDLCLSIKSDLEKLNFSTWIDVESK
jgi:hypothetical protein